MLSDLIGVKRGNMGLSTKMWGEGQRGGGGGGGGGCFDSKKK